MLVRRWVWLKKVPDPHEVLEQSAQFVVREAC